MDRVDSKGVVFAEKRELALQRRESCHCVCQSCLCREERVDSVCVRAAEKKKEKERHLIRS